MQRKTLLGTAWKNVPLCLCNSRAKPSCRPGSKGGHGHMHIPGPGAMEVMGTMGVLSGSLGTCQGLGELFLPCKGSIIWGRVLVFGTLTRSTGGPLHHVLRLQDGHLCDVATFFQSPQTPSTEAKWRTGCLRKKKKKNRVLKEKKKTKEKNNPPGLN